MEMGGELGERKGIEQHSVLPQLPKVFQAGYVV